MKATINARYGEDALLISFKGGQKLTLELSEDFRQYFDEFVNKDLLVEIKPKTKRRSLNANAFMWAMLNDISEKIHIPPKDIYRQLIPYVGGNATTINISTDVKDEFIKIWESNGIGWVCDEVFSDSISTELICYKGSSVYDRAQMSRLIDLVLQEARQQEIPIPLTRAEIQATIERWGNRR